MAKDYLSMANPSPSDVEHYGVKGMKWGVRHDKGHEGEQAKTKTIKKADKKFERSFQGVGGWVKVNNAVADEVNPRVEKLNSSPKYAGKNLYQDKKLHEQYWNDIDKIFDESFKNVESSFGTNASGTRRMSVTREGFGEDASWRAEMVDIQHAGLGLDNYKATFHVEVDDNGQLTRIVFDSLQHDIFSVVEMEENYLAHFGVKGMKWGVRKSDSSGGSKGPKGPPPKAPANESSPQKYNRLRAQIKTHGPNSLEPDELNFVNARTEAIAKVNKMNLSSPGWLTDTSKVVLQDTTKTLMKDLAKAAVKEYIAKPLIKSAIKGS